MNRCINDYRKEHKRAESVLKLAAIIAFIIGMITLVPWNLVNEQFGAAFSDNRGRFAILVGTAMVLGIAATITPSARLPRSLKFTVLCAVRGGRACGINVELEEFIKRVKSLWKVMAASVLIIVLLTAVFPYVVPAHASTGSVSSVSIVGISVPSRPVRVVVTWGDYVKGVNINGNEINANIGFEAEYIRSTLNITIYSSNGEVLFASSFSPSPIGYALTYMRVAKGTVFNDNAAIVIREPVFKVFLNLTTNLVVGDVKLFVNNVTVSYQRMNNGIVAEWIGSPVPQHVEIRSSSSQVEWLIKMNTTIPDSEDNTVKINAKLDVLSSKISIRGKYVDLRILPYKQLSITVLNLSSSTSEGEKIYSEGTGVRLYVFPGGMGDEREEIPNSSNESVVTLTAQSHPSENNNVNVSETPAATLPTRKGNDQMSSYIFIGGVAIAFIGILWKRMPWAAILTVGGIAMIAYSVLFMV